MESIHKLTSSHSLMSERSVNGKDSVGLFTPCAHFLQPLFGVHICQEALNFRASSKVTALSGVCSVRPIPTASTVTAPEPIVFEPQNLNAFRFSQRYRLRSRFSTKMPTDFEGGRYYTNGYTQGSQYHKAGFLKKDLVVARLRCKNSNVLVHNDGRICAGFIQLGVKLRKYHRPEIYEDQFVNYRPHEHW